VTVKRAICCHCESRCGVLVEVDDAGEPVAIRGDEAHPLTHGFLCVRGRAAIEYFQNPRRLDTPLRRVGARGGGRWQPVSWDEALDDIALRLSRIADESGPEAIAYLNGTQFGGDGWFGYRLLHKLGSPNAGGTGLMCGGAQFAAGALTFGFAAAFPDVTPGRTRTIVLWAQQPAASAPVYWGLIREAMRAGAKLVVVDPRPTLEARHADVWLQPRPGTDAALALGVLHEVVAADLWDRELVERWTTGFESLRRRLDEYTPERAAAVSGVDAAAIRDVAHMFATERPAALSVGTTDGQGRNALNLERALAILVALGGSFDVPGGNRVYGPTPGVGSEVTYDAFDELPPGQRAKRLGADRFRLHGEGAEILNDCARRVWFGIPAPITRRSLGIAHPSAIFRAIVTGEPYQVRALIVQHHNPVGAYSGTAAAERALRSEQLELLVVHDLFPTPTAALADYLLPAASWLEKPFLWSSGWGNPIVSGDQVVAPRAERRSDYAFCRDLGRRLGQEWPDSVEDVYDEWLSGAATSFRELVTAERFWHPGSERRSRHEEVDPQTGTPYGFATPSGKIELRSTVLERLGYDPLPAYDDAHDRALAAEPEFPLRLMTGAARIDATHQDHRQVASLRRRHPFPLVEIDPRTATAHGIDDGDWVKIETPRGSVRQRAKIVVGLGADRVNAERWWYPEQSSETLHGVLQSNVNAVTDGALELCDPAYGGLPYRVARCRISRDET
jgi:thiosulfate reductase/polysulfide reductase chain A